MKVEPISKSLTVAAETLKSTLNKNTVIILALDDDGRMNIGWTGEKTLNLLGLMMWGILAINENILNETPDE